jgi:hypothetical protein
MNVDPRDRAAAVLLCAIMLLAATFSIFKPGGRPATV